MSSLSSEAGRRSVSTFQPPTLSSRSPSGSVTVSTGPYAPLSTCRPAGSSSVRRRWHEPKPLRLARPVQAERSASATSEELNELGSRSVSVDGRRTAVSMGAPVQLRQVTPSGTVRLPPRKGQSVMARAYRPCGSESELEKPRDFDPFGQAGFAHLWLQYD